MDHGDIEKYLYALEAQLGATGETRFEIIVCGGAALNFLKLTDRATKDVDILSFVRDDRSGEMILVADDPGDIFWNAARKVALDYGLPDDWINLGPAAQVDTGLPPGFESRLMVKAYGDNLTVRYLSRFDLIFLKLYAAVDQRGRHLEDLVSMKPTDVEMRGAADWCLEQDVSVPFREELVQLLGELGYGDLASKLSK